MKIYTKSVEFLHDVSWGLSLWAINGAKIFGSAKASDVAAFAAANFEET